MQNLEVTAARFAPPRSAATRRRPQTHAHANGYQGRASHAAADQSRRTDGILLRSCMLISVRDNLSPPDRVRQTGGIWAVEGRTVARVAALKLHRARTVA